MARLKEQCPPEGTQHTHISLFLMGERGCTIGKTKLEFFLKFFPKNE